MEHLNTIIHSEIRLMILLILFKKNHLSFVDLQNEIEIKAGTLSSHLKVLKEFDYIKIKKSFESARPKTTLKITETGKLELGNYVKKIKNLLRLVNLVYIVFKNVKTLPLTGATKYVRWHAIIQDRKRKSFEQLHPLG